MTNRNPYDIIQTDKRKGNKPMKFRVIHPAYMPSYFKTKRAAQMFQNIMGGEIQRKVGGEWYGY